MWYFNLKQSGDYSIWVNYDLLEDVDQKALIYDDQYSDHEVALRDLAYQALQKGITSFDTSKRLVMSEEPSIADNYRFIRKYFNAGWANFIFLIRLLSFVNVVKEIKGYRKASQTRKVNVFATNTSVGKPRQMTSSLLSQNPKVSVIIPTLNRYKYLKDVLEDLEKQTYTNFEVLICDQTSPVNEEFYKSFAVDIKLFIEKEKALWKARNLCVRESSGEYMLLFDDDSRVDPDWIEQHLRCIDAYNVEISSGISLSTVGARIPENYSYYRWGDQLDTGNAMVHRSVFEKVGLFDRQFEKQRMGDGEFGLRCYLAGIKNISNPDAKRIHLKVSDGGLRQMGSWDAFRPKKTFSPRPIPSVLYLARKYFGGQHARYLLITRLPPSLVPYKFKSHRLYNYLSFPVFIFILPIVFWQVVKSWRVASRMLKEGAKIEKL